MRVKEIYSELCEVVGSADDLVVFGAATRGIEMLANQGLFDPLIGYVDLSVVSGYRIALPRDIKTPLRININGAPAFARSKFFEFTANTDGTVLGEEDGLQWSDAGYSVIQDETKLPGLLFYKCTDAADVGKTMTVYGRDEEGREIKETITAALSAWTPTVKQFFAVSNVIREATASECYLVCRNSEEDENVGRYYGDEEEPRYRVIKISKTASTIRMMFRKHVFRVTSQEDIINFHSGMAVILATKAARYYLQENFQSAQMAMSEATRIINEEQATREEADAVSQDVLTATNKNIANLDSIIVADIYDDASEILGPVGRNQVFDEITTAVEVLANKGQWDPQLGFVDIFKSANFEEINPSGTAGNGIFVLPRYVDAIISLTINGQQTMPMNRWYEFHLNGSGDRHMSGTGTWHDMGEVMTVNQIPRDATTHLPIPQKLVAIPENVADDGTLVEIYGEDADGREIKVVAPCVHGSIAPDNTQPLIARIYRVAKGESSNRIRLVCLNANGTEGLLLGDYYPDETNPRYRAIKIQTKAACRVRIAYRKRSKKITSLYDPIHLKARLAIKNMLRAIKAQGTDIQAAMQYELLAVNYLKEERIATHPTETGTLQFDPGTSPFHNQNVM